jgi:hypothetical protein
VKPPPPLPEVLRKLREAFARPHLAFGLNVRGWALFWRDGVSGEQGRIATLPHETLETFIASVRAVLGEMRVLRAGLQRKPVRAERRIVWPSRESSILRRS